MTKKVKQYKTPASASAHQAAEALYKIGAIDKITMRDFDESCLEELPSYTGEDIQRIRNNEDVSQPVFARYIGVSKNLVSDWERNIKNPSGPALRLLRVVEKNGLEALV